MSDPKEEFKRILEQGLRAVAPQAAGIEIHIERPKNPEHGDLSSNVAMQLAKQLKRNPREIAQKFVEAAGQSPAIESLTIAGAGFLNVRFKPSAKLEIVRRVLREGANFGKVQAKSRTRSRSSSSRRIRPGRCTSATAARLRSATRSRRCWKRAATR